MGGAGRCHPDFTATQPRTVTSTYANGFLTGVPGYATITYHPNGQVNQVSRANGTTDTYLKDPQNLPRPQRIETRGPDGVLRWSSGAFSFDGAGNVTKTGSHYYLYDRVSRVVSGTVYTGPNGGTVGPKPFSHTFDGFGNLQPMTTRTLARI